MCVCGGGDGGGGGGGGGAAGGRGAALQAPSGATATAAAAAASVAGVRTGYCGSLTTFASWVLELMTEAIADNKWVEAAAAFIVGLYACERRRAGVSGSFDSVWVPVLRK